MKTRVFHLLCLRICILAVTLGTAAWSTAGDFLHIRVMDMQGHKLAEGDVRAGTPDKLFNHLHAGEVQIEITDIHQHVMQFSGDLNADGETDCTIDLARKRPSTAMRSFLVIKEWGPAARTIPCNNDVDAQTKFNTALTLGRQRDQVYVLRLSFGEGCCKVEVLSWNYAETRLK